MQGKTRTTKTRLGAKGVHSLQDVTSRKQKERLGGNRLDPQLKKRHKLVRIETHSEPPTEKSMEKAKCNAA